MKKRSNLNSKSIAIAIALLVLLPVICALTNTGPEDYKPSGSNWLDVEVSSLHILPAPPNVRSQDYLAYEEGTTGNSWGYIIDKDNDGLVLKSVTHILVSYADEANGPFYGILADELTAEELKFFPDIRKELAGSKERIAGVTDGIVWISSKYVKIEIVK